MSAHDFKSKCTYQFLRIIINILTLGPSKGKQSFLIKQEVRPFKKRDKKILVRKDDLLLKKYENEDDSEINEEEGDEVPNLNQEGQQYINSASQQNARPGDIDRSSFDTVTKYNFNSMGNALIGESGRSSILPNKKRSREEMENPEVT